MASDCPPPYGNPPQCDQYAAKVLGSTYDGWRAADCALFALLYSYLSLRTWQLYSSGVLQSDWKQRRMIYLKGCWLCCPFLLVMVIDPLAFGGYTIDQVYWTFFAFVLGIVLLLGSRG
eukprot:TRINITY_DN2114_c0_g1_i5.p1 TRINITY_DN2114_c0_g1~~TRINITY_DN2114_c0_g1_i5.p1  ORF type:complete len:138 (+),score=35.32 TRINITY_DN2114_c0_g1_i5:63-416(+)